MLCFDNISYSHILISPFSPRSAGERMVYILEGFRFSKSLFEKEKVCEWCMKHLFISLYNVSLKGLPQILFLSILGNAGERMVYILEHTGNVHYLILWGKENFWWMGLKNYSLIKRTNIKEIQFVTQVRPSTESFIRCQSFFFYMKTHKLNCY